jgi:hypothetical protein
LELLDLLCQGPRTVETLAREANLGLANTSQHLKQGSVIVTVTNIHSII